VTEKSVLADAIQLPLGRRCEKAITGIQAKPKSRSGINGVGGQSYDCSAKGSHHLRRPWAERAQEGLGELKNEFQISVQRRSAGEPLACAQPGTIDEVQSGGDKPTDHVNLVVWPRLFDGEIWKEYSSGCI
jgi:hypothetical protein